MVKDVGFGLASESVCLVLDEDQGGVLDFWDTKYAGRIGLNSARRSVWQLVAVVSGEAQDVGAGDGFTGLVIDDEAFDAAKSIFEFRDTEVVSGSQDESVGGARLDVQALIGIFWKSSCRSTSLNWSGLQRSWPVSRCIQSASTIRKWIVEMFLYRTRMFGAGAFQTRSVETLIVFAVIDSIRLWHSLPPMLSGKAFFPWRAAS